MKPSWAAYVLWLVIALAGTTAMLTACGQKGGLYLPDEADNEEHQLQEY